MLVRERQATEEAAQAGVQISRVKMFEIEVLKRLSMLFRLDVKQ
jgi:hypothetical protein